MESHGALVGWSHQDLGDKVMLRVETVCTREAADDHTPDILRVLLTRQQAGVLAAYLFDISGHAAPRRRDRGVLKRLFG